MKNIIEHTIAMRKSNLIIDRFWNKTKYINFEKGFLPYAVYQIQMGVETPITEYISMLHEMLNE